MIIIEVELALPVYLLNPFARREVDLGFFFSGELMLQSKVHVA